MELTIALPALFERLPDTALDILPEAIRYKMSTAVHESQPFPLTLQLGPDFASRGLGWS